MSDSHHKSDDAAFDQEISYGSIRGFGIGLFVVIVASMVVTWWIVVGARNEARSQDPAPSPLAETAESWEPPGPRLQEFPPTLDIEAHKAWEKDQLNHFAHIDESAGTVRIPIDQAIEILAVRGFPERGEVDAMANEVFGAVRTSDVSAAGGSGVN